MDKIVDGAWVKENAKKYKKDFRRSYTHFTGTFSHKKNYALDSKAADYLIQRERMSGKYSFEKMLIIQDPFLMTPLCAYVLFSTKESYQVRYVVKGKLSVDNYEDTTEFAHHHCVPIIGLYPDSFNEVQIELIDKDGNVVKSKTLMLKTLPLPEELLDTISQNKKESNSSDTFLLVAGGVDIHTCAFDGAGDIRYFLSVKPKGYGILPLKKGHFLFIERKISAPSYTNPHGVVIHDMDYMGRVYKTYIVKNGLHHTAFEMENGNILSPSSTMKGHSEDIILEVNRKIGQVENSLELADFFDETYQDMKDWAHINAVSHNVKEDTVLASMRNIHSVAKFGWGDKKELKWILADPRFWENTPMKDKVLTPVGDVKWFYQQHAAYEIKKENEESHIKHYIVFDNHWHKRRKVEFFDNDGSSYVNFYTVDEKNMTVQMEKRIPCPKSKIRSNAIYKEDSKRVYIMAGYLEPKVEESLGLIQEYDYEADKILREYYVKPGFFTAYEFAPHINALNVPIESDSDYLVGSATQFVKEENITRQCKMLSKEEDIDFLLGEDYLYVKAKDHYVKKVHLQGKNTCYAADFSNTYQTMKVFEDSVYYTVMSLGNVVPDSYEILLETEDETFRSGERIRKNTPVDFVLTRVRQVYNKIIQ